MRVSALTLTIRVGGDASGLCGGTGSVAVECQHPNGVLCELVESVHLVGESVHLHTLEQHKQGGFSSAQFSFIDTETSVISMRPGWKHCEQRDCGAALTCSFPDGLSVQSSL